MSRINERDLIVSLTPAPGFYAVLADPDSDGPVEFWPLVGWALVERDHREEYDEPPKIERVVEGMIALSDMVESCEDREFAAMAGYLFLGYVHACDAPTWEKEAARQRHSYRREQAAKKAKG